MKGEKHDFILIPSQTRTPSPLILDQNYINTKNQVIKAERRVLKELGFCVHVKHPHKVSGSHLQWNTVCTAGLNSPVPSVSRSSSCTFRCWSVRRTRSWSRQPGEFLVFPHVPADLGLIILKWSNSCILFWFPSGSNGAGTPSRVFSPGLSQSSSPSVPGVPQPAPPGS